MPVQLSKTSLLNNYLFNMKNVFFAQNGRRTPMVIKKLAHNKELDEFDRNENSCVLKMLAKIDDYRFGPANTLIVMKR